MDLVNSDADVSPNSLDFFITGNVCKSEAMKTNDLLLFGKVDPGFLMHSIDGDVMTNTFVDSNNNVI